MESDYKIDLQIGVVQDLTKIEVILTDPRASVPKAQTRGSAGLDLRVFLPNDLSHIHLDPGAQVMLDTGMRIWIKDPNYAGFMFARSGTGTKGLVLGNGTGVIDSDYQGPLKVCLWNRDDQPFTINDGDRVAQMVIMPVASGYAIHEVEEFEAATERGVGGFGSTGMQ